MAQRTLSASPPCQSFTPAFSRHRVEVQQVIDIVVDSFSVGIALVRIHLIGKVYSNKTKHEVFGLWGGGLLFGCLIMSRVSA